MTAGSTTRNKHAISVIIPTIGRWASVCDVLTDLDTIRGELTIDVVLVGDGFTARQVADHMLDRTPLGLQVQFAGVSPRSGAAVARNHGAALAPSAELVFLDDDVRLAHDWAAALRAALDAGWTCVTGPVTSAERSSLARAREDRYQRRYAALVTGDSVDFLAGGNSAVRASLLRAAGGFPEIAVASDTALLSRLEALGVHCQFSADLVVYHVHDRGWRTAIVSAWRAGYRADRAGLRREATSLARSLSTSSTVGAVNVALFVVKVGGYAFRPRGAKP